MNIPESDLIDDKLEQLIKSKIPEGVSEDDMEEAFDAIGDVVFAVIDDLVSDEKIAEMPDFDATVEQQQEWLNNSFLQIVDAVNLIESEGDSEESEDAE